MKGWIDHFKGLIPCKYPGLRLALRYIRPGRKGGGVIKIWTVIDTMSLFNQVSVKYLEQR